MTVVGFSGSRHGMTVAQEARVSQLLGTRCGLDGPAEARHGDCVGSDEQFHDLALAFGYPVVVHPPTDPKHRAWCSGAGRRCSTAGENVTILEPQPYLARNRAIVNVSGLVIAAPAETVEPRSTRGQGTWSTIRYTLRQGVPIVVVGPNGEDLTE